LMAGPDSPDPPRERAVAPVVASDSDEPSTTTEPVSPVVPESPLRAAPPVAVAVPKTGRLMVMPATVMERPVLEAVEVLEAVPVAPLLPELPETPAGLETALELAGPVVPLPFEPTLLVALDWALAAPVWP
jgi:hypothetical protein